MKSTCTSLVFLCIQVAAVEQGETPCEKNCSCRSLMDWISHSSSISQKASLRSVMSLEIRFPLGGAAGNTMQPKLWNVSVQKGYMPLRSCVHRGFYLLRAPRVHVSGKPSYFWENPGQHGIYCRPLIPMKLNTATQCRSTSPEKVIIPPESVRKSSALNTTLVQDWSVTTERPCFVCRECGKTFRYKSNVYYAPESSSWGKTSFVYQSGKSF